MSILLEINGSWQVPSASAPISISSNCSTSSKTSLAFERLISCSDLNTSYVLLLIDLEYDGGTFDRLFTVDSHTLSFLLRQVELPD